MSPTCWWTSGQLPKKKPLPRTGPPPSFTSPVSPGLVPGASLAQVTSTAMQQWGFKRAAAW